MDLVFSVIKKCLPPNAYPKLLLVVLDQLSKDEFYTSVGGTKCELRTANNDLFLLHIIKNPNPRCLCR